MLHGPSCGVIHVQETAGMCRLYVWASERSRFVCVHRKWLAHVVKVRSAVLHVFVCASVCARSQSQLRAAVVFVWMGCSESPGGILGIDQ